MNDLAVIGSNNPPDMTITASEVMTALSDFMAETPVIEDENKAREAKVFVDRAKLCLADMEDERDKKVRPLNEQVKSINTFYRPAREALERVLSELSQRITVFLAAEERTRIAAAQEAARIAQELEQAARDAERRELEAIESAKQGVLGVDIKASVTEADIAFSRFKKAERQAAVAEKDTKIRLAGGLSRAIGLKNQETLICVDAAKALACIGATAEIKEAILKGARAYRKLHGLLPDGITSETERGI